MANSIIKYLIDQLIILFRPLLDGGVKAVARQLFLKGPLIFRILALLFLSGAGYLGYQWYHHTEEIQKVIRSAIANEIESTPQKHKGIEVVIMPNLTTEIKSILDQKPLPAFCAKFAELNNAFSAKVHSANANITLQKFSPGNNEDYYFTNRQDLSSFLFIPGNILNIPNPNKKPEDQIRSNHKILYEEIIRTNNAAPLLSEFKKVELFRQSPILENRCSQAYIITSSGVLRIHESGAIPDQTIYYSKKFKPYEYFPGRPYFWPTVEKGKIAGYSDDSIEKYFKPSNLYFDLGGNGIVMTLCKSLGNPKDNCIACFDYGFMKDLASEIKNRLTVLGGNVYEIEVRPGTVVNNDKISENSLRALNYYLRTKHDDGKWDEIYEEINMISRGDVLSFTVPLPKHGMNDYHLLYCELDLSRISKAALWYGGGSVGFAAFGFIFVVLLLADYGYRKKRDDESFKAFASAMTDLKLPFFRLNEDDEITEMNAAFWKLFGYKNEKEASFNLIGKKFREMIEKKSLGKYDEVQFKNKKGQKAESHYTLSLNKFDSLESVEVEIYRGASPVPSLLKDELPQTFGVLVKKGVEEKILEEELISPK